MPMSAGPARVPLVYRIVMWVATPIVRWWGRIEVVNPHLVPAQGATVIMANHDSQWDPVVIGIATGRQIRALAKASLWKNKGVAWVLDHMGQIPIERGRGDSAALQAAIDQLAAGGCIGVFPEGTVSRGKQMRPLSGAGRLVLAVPGTHVVCAAVTGAVDIARFPHRPRIAVRFFEPAGGQVIEGESAVALTKRAMSEIRELAPWVAAGRGA